MSWSYTLWGRPRSWARDNWVRGRMIQDKRTREGKLAHANAATAAWRGQALVGFGVPLAADPDGSWAVDVVAHYDNKRHGDADRVLTLVLDALQGIAYASDRQVKRASVEVRIDRENPRTEVRVRRLDEAAQFASGPLHEDSARATAVQMAAVPDCTACGEPTMHAGPVCYGCSQEGE